MDNSDNLDKILGIIEEPDEILDNPELIKELVDAFKPALRVAGRELIAIIKEVNDNSEFFLESARNVRNFYNAFLEVGFSKEEAFALLLNHRLQLTESIKKLQANAANISNIRERGGCYE